MYNPSVKFTTPRTTVVLNAFPYGKFNNETAKNAKDGAYLDQWWANEFNGFAQAVITAAGTTPNGAPEQANNSQVLDGVRKITNVPSAPRIVGVLKSTTAGTWAGDTNAINVASVTPVTTSSATKQEGELDVVATTAGSKDIAVNATPSKAGARYGAMYGIDTTAGSAVIKAVSSYGFRATLQFNGTTWEAVNTEDPKYNSAEIGFSAGLAPTITENVSSGYFDIIWPEPVTGFEFSENWVVQEVSSVGLPIATARDYTPMVSHLEEFSQALGRSTRVYFLPNKPVRGSILMSGSTPEVYTALGQVSSGISALDYTDKVLTITHDKRSGPAFCQFASVSTSAAFGALYISAFPKSTTQTEIIVYDSAGVEVSIADQTLLSFSREVGGSDTQSPPTGTRVVLANGVGLMPQDARTTRGNININQVNS